MALLLRNDKDIEGIIVEDLMNLLGQYADDADLYLLYTQKVLDSVFLCLERFRQLSGFSINYDKMTILRIGSMKNSNNVLITKRKVAWTSDYINVLGIWIHTDIPACVNRNYQELMDKATIMLQRWEGRSMSLIGKVTIINTLIASIFVYRMMVLSRMPNTMFETLQKMFDKFLWNGWKPKINQKILTMPKNEGGLKLVDMEVKDKALKLSWIQILTKEPKLKRLAYLNMGNIMPNNEFWSCNLFFFF